MDTFGETKSFLKLSKIAFMGKSVCAHGGQNPLEAARLGNRIIHGPNIENFIEVYDLLKKQGISTKIKTYKDLEKLVVKFYKKKNYSQQIIKKLTYIGNQILLKNEKEINKYCVIYEFQKTKILGLFEKNLFGQLILLSFINYLFVNSFWIRRIPSIFKTSS